jgi:hypothetical protein
MEQRLEELQTRLEALQGELREVKTRLERLEARDRAAPQEPSATPPDRMVGATAHEGGELKAPAPLIPARTISLIGRTLVILGGAYLFRAISETGFVPALVGALAGLAYAIWWLVQADRTAGRDQRLSAVFYGFAAAMIACPLIWEATARFELFGATTAAAALVVFVAVGLTVAWRRQLGEMAWTIVLFTLATTVSLVIGTREFLPYAVALLVLAAAVELVAFHDRWLGLRWPVAVGVDLAVLIMTSVALRPATAGEGSAAVSSVGVIAVSLAVAVLYLSSIGARTLLREQLITPFGTMQVAAALLVGFGSAVRVIVFEGVDPMAVGVVILLLGIACYAIAFASIDRRLGRGRNFYSYTTFAGLLVLAGSYMILGDTTLALTWCALAVAATGIGGQFDRITLKFHGAIYITAAAVVGGLIACAFDGLLAAPTGAWRPVTPIGIAMTLVAASCYGILIATRANTASQWLDLLPQAIVGAVVVWSVAGITAPWLAGSLLAAPGASTEAAVLAASRTAVIAVLAVALAWAGRRWSLQELIWLVYPLLVGGGVKLLLEDFAYGQPLTLFVALALYGSALILTSRLIRKET